MNVQAPNTPLVLLCPAWKRFGSVQRIKPGTIVLHSPQDDVVPYADSVELLKLSGLDPSCLWTVGTDHRLSDPEPLAAMLRAVER